MADTTVGVQHQDDPQHRTHYRLGGLSGFVPLNEDQITISTRNQRLPALFQTRSSTSLFALGGGRTRSEAPVPPPASRPRRSSFNSGGSTGDEESQPLQRQRSNEENDANINLWGPQPSPGRRRTTFSDLSQVDSRDRDPRRMSLGPEILNTPQMRSMRLIGNSNPRYRWRQYFKSEEQLKKMPNKALREYYRRCNYLISHYIYIDKLLDSSLPHDLIQEYSNRPIAGGRVEFMDTITEEAAASPATGTMNGTPTGSVPPSGPVSPHDALKPKVKRTPKNLYKLPESSQSVSSTTMSPSETSPLLGQNKTIEDDVF
jgi:hypothetical protein